MEFYSVPRHNDLHRLSEVGKRIGPTSKSRNHKELSQQCSLVELLAGSGSYKAEESTLCSRRQSPRTVQAVNQRELEALSVASDRKSAMKGKVRATPDPLSSSSDHRRSADIAKTKRMARGSGGDLSRPMARTSSNWNLMSLKKKANDPLSLTSVSDHVRQSKTIPPKMLINTMTIEASCDVTPPRAPKMVDSLSRFSEHIRSLPSRSNNLKKTDLTSFSDHVPAWRRKSVRTVPSLSAHVVAATSQSSRTRRVRFEVDEIDYFEYEGPTAEEKAQYVTSKADSKSRKQQVIVEGKALAERDPAWVKAIETLFESPLKRRSPHNDPSEMGKDQAIRVIMESGYRGLENKCTPMIQRHCRWAISTVLSRQGQLKLEHATAEERAEELRVRFNSVSKCSADFARLLGQADAEFARAIHDEESRLIAF